MDQPKRFGIIRDPHGDRAKTAKLLITSLMKSTKFRESCQAYKNGIVIGIERGIFNFVVIFMQNNNKIASWTLHSFINEYRRKRYLLCLSIDKIDDPSSDLETIIMTRSIDWDQLAFVGASDLNPTKYAAVVSDLQIRSNSKVEYNFIEGCIPCGNCGSKKYQECSVQLCSLDESAHNFHICGGCGKRTRA